MRRRHAPGTIAIGLAILALISGSAAVADDRRAPFVMIAAATFSDDTERAAIASVLRDHIRPDDYLGEHLAQSLPELAARVGQPHIFTLPANLDGVRAAAARCDPADAGLLIYDPEHWAGTPEAERADLPAAIATAKALVLGQAAAPCRQFGIAPDGRFSGLEPDHCRGTPNRDLIRAIDWTGIASYNIQAQILLGDACLKRAGLDPYVAFVRGVADAIRSRSPTTLVTAQLGFRGVPPGRMIAAIHALGASIDGYYLAYPRTPGSPCRYCSPNNLAKVIAAIHTPG